MYYSNFFMALGCTLGLVFMEYNFDSLQESQWWNAIITPARSQYFYPMVINKLDGFSIQEYEMGNTSNKRICKRDIRRNNEEKKLIENMEKKTRLCTRLI